MSEYKINAKLDEKRCHDDVIQQLTHYKHRRMQCDIEI